MRISFAALSLAFMLSIGCGGTEDATTTDTTDAPAVTATTDGADTGSMTTEDGGDEVNAEDVVLVKLELPGMT